MRAIKVKELAQAVSGQLLRGEAEAVVASVSTDTRTMKNGDVFIALIGERYDAHNFLSQAVAKGASVLIVSRFEDGFLPAEKGPAVILVDDTTAALQRLARYNRQESGIPVVAVTGSNGKTSTKDLLAAVLATRFNTVKTRANLNNHIGLPLTLLEIEETTEIAVVEMGMRGRGEIAELCSIALPTVGVITNIGEAHLELLGSRENIAQAKGELLDFLPPEGMALLNGDDDLLPGQAGRCRCPVYFFGSGDNCQIRVKDIVTRPEGSEFSVTTPWGEGRFFLAAPGRHNVWNALPAVALGLRYGLTAEEIGTALSNVRLTGMRMEVLKGEGVTVINDAYNASPLSMKAALDFLAAMSGRRVAVLGDMYELGERTEEGHREVGAYAARTGVDLLVVTGKYAELLAAGALAAGMDRSRIKVYPEPETLIAHLPELIQKGDTVLVKASRGMQLERVVRALVPLGEK